MALKTEHASHPRRDYSGKADSKPALLVSLDRRLDTPRHTAQKHPLHQQRCQSHNNSTTAPTHGSSRGPLGSCYLWPPGRRHGAVAHLPPAKSSGSFPGGCLGTLSPGPHQGHGHHWGVGMVREEPPSGVWPGNFCASLGTWSWRDLPGGVWPENFCMVCDWRGASLGRGRGGTSPGAVARE